MSYLTSNIPLFFLQISNDPLQLPTFLPLHRLQDLSGTLRLAHWGLASERLAVLLDKGVLVLPEERGPRGRGSAWMGSSLDTHEA